MNIKEAIRTSLLHRGWFVSNSSADGEIREFLKTIRPKNTPLGLLRLGNAADGGYLVPNDLGGVKYCFSPGVSDNSSFEADLAARGIESFMADWSVAGPATESKMFHFEKRYLGARTDETMMTLKDWVLRSVPDDSNDLMLQMDIEGSEYDVIFDTPEHIWRRFRIAVVEFHDFNYIFNPMDLRLMSLCFARMLRVFDVVHIHPNNGSGSSKRRALEIPRMLEFTFLRKDRIQKWEYASDFPHSLDRPNYPHIPDLLLPQCWYQ